MATVENTYNAAKSHQVAPHARVTGRTLQDVCAQLEVGYGEMGRSLARTLTYAIVRYHGASLTLWMPPSNYLHRDLLRVHEGERSTVQIGGVLNGYTGAFVFRWDEMYGDWSYSANT